MVGQNGNIEQKQNSEKQDIEYGKNFGILNPENISSVAKNVGPKFESGAKEKVKNDVDNQIKKLTQELLGINQTIVKLNQQGKSTEDIMKRQREVINRITELNKIKDNLLAGTNQNQVTIGPQNRPVDTSNTQETKNIPTTPETKESFNSNQALAIIKSLLTKLPNTQLTPEMKQVLATQKWESGNRNIYAKFQEQIGLRNLGSQAGYLGRKTINALRIYINNKTNPNEGVGGQFTQEKQNKPQEKINKETPKKQIGPQTQSESTTTNSGGVKGYDSYVFTNTKDSPINDISNTEKIAKTSEEKQQEEASKKNDKIAENAGKGTEKIKSDYEKGLEGLASRYTSTTENLKNTAREYKNISTGLTGVQSAKNNFEQQRKDLEKEKTMNEEEKQDTINKLDTAIQTLEEDIKKLTAQKEEMKKEIENLKAARKDAQINYLKSISAEKGNLSNELSQGLLTPAQQEQARAKLDILTSIEYSQRMIAGIDATPNRFGFYMHDGVILRKSEKIDQTAEQDMAEGFYQLDNVGRLTYINKDSSGKDTIETFAGYTNNIPEQQLNEKGGKQTTTKEYVGNAQKETHADSYVRLGELWKTPRELAQDSKDMQTKTEEKKDNKLQKDREARENTDSSQK